MYNRCCFATVVASLALSLLAFSAFPQQASAQLNPTDPATVRVTQIKVKPGYNDVWRDMFKEVLMPYFKSAKWPALSVYRTRFSDATFVTVAPVETSDMTGQRTEDGGRKFREAARAAVEWSRSHVQRKHTDLSFGSAPDSPPAHLSVSRITIAPGKRNEFIKQFGTIGIPRWKKAGMKFLITWEVLYGERSGEFVVVTPIANYAELAEGTPFYRGMSEADRAQMLTSMAGVITNIQRLVVDHIPELSFTAE